MEKLQKALEKAREQRGDADPGWRAPAPHGTPAATIQSSQADAWAELQKFQPDPKRMIKSRIMTAEAGPGSTPFDILRTKIALTMQKNGWRRLAITSPTASCGKSTTAANLAFGYGRQRDRRCILMELDLRHPSIGQMLGLVPPADITEFLSGETPFADQAVRFRDNVALSVPKRPATDPTSVLQNRITQTMLESVEAQFAPDIMIFDLPPLLASDDTRAFLRNVDCALMVARAETSTVAQIDTCEREMAEHTNVLGVVLNRCRQDTDTDGFYD